MTDAKDFEKSVREFIAWNNSALGEGITSIFGCSSGAPVQEISVEDSVGASVVSGTAGAPCVEFAIPIRLRFGLEA